jgi:Ca-activated chloride channel family protein
VGRGAGIVVAGLALWAAQAAAQEPATPPVFDSALDTVNVTVTVRDARGHLIPDLKADDFLVFEDGRPQKVHVFAPAMEPGEKEALTLDLGLLLDTSESMLKVLRLTKEAAVRFLENVPRARDLLTIFFDQDIRVSRYDSENQQGLFERIMAAKGGGNTALYDAITVYLSRVDEAPGRKVLVVFTDGEDSTSAVTLSEVLRLLRSSSVTVYPIAFTSGFPTGSTRGLTAMACLREMAALTGGQVFQPSASADLRKVYDTILDELGNQYVLGYTSDSIQKDGRFRKLRVAVKRKGFKVRHREGYFGPSGS